MIRDIMVHLDGSSEDQIRLEYGQAIATTDRARLIGVFTNLLPDMSVVMPFDAGAAAAVQVVSELEEQARKDGDATAERLAKELEGMQVPGELHRFDETLGSMAIKVAGQARCADLFVSTRPRGAKDTTVWLTLVEAVLFGSGRGLVLVPPAYQRRSMPQTILIAWNGSREAARALREGLSFIERAAHVVVLVIDPSEDSAAGSDVKSHLLRYGVTPEIVAVESQGRSIADVVLAEANRVSADLVVMGGYGHTRLREQIFGGATLDMLTASDRPLLLAH